MTSIRLTPIHECTALVEQVMQQEPHDADCEAAPHRLFGTPCDCRAAVECTCTRKDRLVRRLGRLMSLYGSSVYVAGTAKRTDRKADWYTAHDSALALVRKVEMLP